MNETPSAISLEVLVVHGPSWTEDGRTGFDAAIGAALVTVEAPLRSEHPPLRLAPRFLASDDQQPSVGHPAIAIVDVSTSDGALAFLVGRFAGQQVPCIFICRRLDIDSASNLGLDVALVHQYDSVDHLATHSVLQQDIRGRLSPNLIVTAMVHKLWFPPGTTSIRVVCPQVLKPTAFAARSDPDYTYLDNLGDTDALLDLMVFLSRRYPSADISQHSANDLPRDHASDNLVVIGGPGDTEEISNQICQMFMSEIGSRVSYSDDCNTMIVKGADGVDREFSAQMAPATGAAVNASTFAVRRDHGYFARFPNPLSGDTSVILVNGIHTPGVLGAGRAFGDRAGALKNYYAVLARGADPAKFECHFDVRVINGDPQVPQIAVADVLPLGPITAQPTARPTSSATVDLPTPARVVIVAGDRGGSQMSSVQIPRESEGIQEVLLACTYRDAITFAALIQVATAHKVAAASRHNPTVMHFAGHGDERSLSFVEDEDVVVSPTRVSAEQLGNILREFPRRVRLCVLNTCESSAIARHLVTSRAVDFAIGWPNRVSDRTAIAFSNGLYTHLGEGYEIRRAVQLAAASGDGSATPELFAADGLDPNTPLVQGVEFQ